MLFLSYRNLNLERCSSSSKHWTDIPELYYLNIYEKLKSGHTFWRYVATDTQRDTRSKNITHLFGRGVKKNQFFKCQRESWGHKLYSWAVFHIFIILEGKNIYLSITDTDDKNQNCRYRHNAYQTRSYFL